MTPLALLFFLAFAVSLVGSYLAVRRGIARPGMVAAGSVILGVLWMTLFGLAQEVVVLHALLVGVLLGGGLSLIALAMAWYFQGNEQRERKLKTQISALGSPQE